MAKGLVRNYSSFSQGSSEMLLETPYSLCMIFTKRFFKSSLNQETGISYQVVNVELR